MVMNDQPTPSTEEHTPAHRQLVHDALVSAGVCTAAPTPLTDARPLPDDQRTTLARQVARGRLLSEYIREEREGN